MEGYRCLNCSIRFETPSRFVETHGEAFTGCSHCLGDYEALVACGVCGGFYTEDAVCMGMCALCVADAVAGYTRALGERFVATGGGEAERRFYLDFLLGVQCGDAAARYLVGLVKRDLPTDYGDRLRAYCLADEAQWAGYYYGMSTG